MGLTNQLLTRARANRADEFYTLLPDIERELIHYTGHFAGQVVYLNCDDPQRSNFYRYFQSHHERLKIKRIICTHYLPQADLLDKPARRHCNRTDPLAGDGDFRSAECREYLAQADIVVTNPPFSLMSEFLLMLLESGKKFLIVGSLNAVKVKRILPHFAAGRFWLGVGRLDRFVLPDHYETTTVDSNGNNIGRMNNVRWLTNLRPDISRKFEPSCTRPIESYAKFDNYDAINVDRLVDTPADYSGRMGVPLTYLHYYDPEEYDLFPADSAQTFVVNGRAVYYRLIIQKKKNPSQIDRGLGGLNKR